MFDTSHTDERASHTTYIPGARRPLVVNLFGGPGVGKSTTRAGVFNRLKNENVNVEELPEFAKELTYGGNFADLRCQAFVTGTQLRNLERLLSHVDVIVTDSPILLGALYSPPEYPPMWEVFLVHMHNRFKNFNFLLTREKPYHHGGRFQTEEEAMAIDGRVRYLLDSHGMGYTTVRGTSTAHEEIALKVLACL